jgi:hypothetical protein
MTERVTLRGEEYFYILLLNLIYLVKFNLFYFNSLFKQVLN